MSAPERERDWESGMQEVGSGDLEKNTASGIRLLDAPDKYRTLLKTASGVLSLRVCAHIGMRAKQKF